MKEYICDRCGMPGTVEHPYVTSLGTHHYQGCIAMLKARAEKAEGQRDSLAVQLRDEVAETIKVEQSLDAAVQVLAKCLHDCAMYSADPIARIEVCLRNRPEVAVLVDAALAEMINAKRPSGAGGSGSE